MQWGDSVHHTVECFLCFLLTTPPHLSRSLEFAISRSDAVGSKAAEANIKAVSMILEVAVYCLMVVFVIFLVVVMKAQHKEKIKTFKIKMFKGKAGQARQRPCSGDDGGLHRGDHGEGRRGGGPARG